MIFWISSYPKSGNTWLRALLSAYYFTKDGFFLNDNLLENIEQFPQKKFFEKFKYKSEVAGETVKLWIKAQELINSDKRIRFFKTHNVLGVFEGNYFTNIKNSIAAIYIVRDPRNVVSSIKNHFELSYNQALEFMNNEKKFTYDNLKKNDYSDFQFISSWEKNYQSWIYSKSFPIKVVKYEDLERETFYVFKDIINFINKILKNELKFDKHKALNAVKSTSFTNLKKLENEKGFSESIKSNNIKRQIPFFHLGPGNDWRKFDINFQNELNTIFEKNLIELNYK